MAISKFILPLIYLLSLFILEAIRWNVAAEMLFIAVSLIWISAVIKKWYTTKNQLRPASLLSHEQAPK